jgi:methylmalonyl-CoA/ethylmalonyl-CoA epimerase
MIGPIHHVGVAVENLEPALERYRILGLMPDSVEDLAPQGVRVAFLRTGGAKIEFVAPLSPQSTISRFLATRGEGLHHLAFASQEITADLKALAANGFELIDRTPRPGALGSRVAFVHPRSAHGVLLELVEDAKRP